MGKRGTKPKPTALRVLHGDREDRINRNEPQPAAKEVDCPDWLPPLAVEIWERLGPDLAAKGVLTFWDVDLFARFCWLTAQNRELMAIVEAEGLIVNGDKGVRVKNPAMQLVRDTTAQMVSIGARFGLTPSDRSQLSLGTEEGNADGAERLLS